MLAVNTWTGCRAVTLSDPLMGSVFPVVAMYPSDDPERVERFGPFEIAVAKDGRVQSGRFPLVVISHGSGGSHLVYRTMAAHLARNGFVVAMPEHPGNNRNNNELAGTAANLEARPRLVRLVIDWAYSAEGFCASLAPDSVAIAGHSMGGYTALAAAGGKPAAFPHETPDGKARAIDVAADGRIKALVLLAPAVAWFLAPGALSDVRVPILMLTAEKDVQTPVGHKEILKAGLADWGMVEHRVIENAGHYSFLSPFPEAMTKPEFAPSQDPEGFDRGRFHEQMNAEVTSFLRRALSGGRAQAMSENG